MHKTYLSKKDFAKLAEGIQRQEQYESEIRAQILQTAQNFEVDTDFISVPLNSSIAIDSIRDVIQDFSEPLLQEFDFLHYECSDSFDEYNSRIWNPDDSHPNVHSLEELYDEVIKE